MNGHISQNLITALADKEFRHSYMSEHIRTGIAHQVRAIREANGWSQADMANHVGKTQSVISRIEDPDYGRLSLQTLIDLAAAFDVALSVRFVSFSELLEQVKDLSPKRLRATKFADDDLTGE